MFNNCNSKENGEHAFYVENRHLFSVVFDVGCRYDSEFLDFTGEVHYFDPSQEFIQRLSSQASQNSRSYFNSFGLGNDSKDMFYYPRYQSFYDRTASCGISDDENKVVFKIKKASEYIIESKIESIDFLKIDTEGFELEVLKGFDEHLSKVKLIQFEYGGTFLDNKVKLLDVIEYLRTFGFHQFSYICNNGIELIRDFTDHYQYCNIVCTRKDSGISLF